MTDTGLVSKMYEQLIQLNIKTTNNHIKKMGRRTKLTFFQRRNTDGQQAHEKILNITNHWENANQHHSEKSPHTCQNGFHQKEHKKCWQGCGEKGTLEHS